MLYNLSIGSILFTFHLNDYKMREMYSLNTSTKANKFCNTMHGNKDCVCSSCYAFTLESMRGKVRRRYEENGITLSKRVMKDSEVPILDFDYTRFNAFGELLNIIHYRNLMKIVEANPKVVFALWTKRPELFKKEMVLADNLFYIYSSLKRNEEPKLPKGFNKTFTVFNKPFAREHDTPINCSASCKSCLLCYSDNDIIAIHELIR